MPSSPHTSGNTQIKIIWNTSVRKNDTIADVTPSFNAVKNPDEKMQKPHRPKESPYNLNPLVVICNSSVSPEENIAEMGLANTSTRATSTMLKMDKMSKLFLSKLFSSAWFFAPLWYPTTGAEPML